MLYLFLADGFEEIEALAPVDFIRRASLEVKTVGVTGNVCTGAHNIEVSSDISPADMILDQSLEGIILPGGMPGADNLDKAECVAEALKYCVENNKMISAICASPFILGKRGLLKGRKATCFPGFEDYLEGAFVCEEGVVTDGNIITAKGAGAAWEFGAEIVGCLKGKAESDKILKAIQWKK